MVTKIGDTGDDQLDGTSGDDTLEGRGGNDILNGGAGKNDLRGEDGHDTLNDDGVGSILDGGPGSDIALVDRRTSSVAEALVFTPGALLTFSDGTAITNVETLFLRTGGGDDSLAIVHPDELGAFNSFGGWDAGGGYDSLVLDFSGYSTIVTGNSYSSYSIYTNAGLSMSFTNVESVKLIGGKAGDNFGSTPGADYFDGAAGRNRISYLDYNIVNGVTVDLNRSGPQDTGGGGVDTLLNIQDIFGSLWNDTLTGTADSNVLEGSNGDDTLVGGGGADTLNGGAGNDIIRDAGSGSQIDGGDGFDTLYLDRHTATAAITVGTGYSSGPSIEGSYNGGGFYDGTKFKGINALHLATGSGDDSFQYSLYSDLSGIVHGGWEAGGGTDQLRLDYWGGSVAIQADWNGTRFEVRQDGAVQFAVTDVEIFQITGSARDDVIRTGAGGDELRGGVGDDALDGGAGIDTATFAGAVYNYSIAQPSKGVFTITGPDGTDTLTNIEFAQFDDTRLRLLPGEGTVVDFNSPGTAYMSAIRDFDGNDLGAAADWQHIGVGSVTGGATAHIYGNRTLGRWAVVTKADDGQVYFDDHGWGGATRVVGIYIDPLVQSGEVAAGSDHDSQRRFQNDLKIGNIAGVLGAFDYDRDGLQEVYFKLSDATAYLHAYMHADGNIRYANYQNEQQVKDFMAANGWGAGFTIGWFSAHAAAPSAATSDLWQDKSASLAAPLSSQIQMPFDSTPLAISGL